VKKILKNVKICNLIPGLLLALLLSACSKEESSDTDVTTNDRAVLISMQKAELRRPAYLAGKCPTGTQPFCTNAGSRS